MRKLRILLPVLILTVALLLAGCISDKGQVTKSASDSLEKAGIEGYAVKDGDAKEVTTKDSESHQMIVKMRLLQYGMSPKLEDYRNTYLVDMKNTEGEIITVVVVNEDGEMKSLLPENQPD